MANMDAPSFSLGLDFDFDSEPQQQPVSGIKDPITSCNSDTAHLSSSSNVALHTIQEEDENAADHFTDFTMELELEVPDPDRPLRRLRRGPPASQSQGPLSKKVCVEIDDDIEEFSSQEEEEDRFPDSNGKHPFSVCSSSKLSLRSRGVLSSQKTYGTEAMKTRRVPNVTASASTSVNNKSVVFPELTVSPLRKFQLIDSDSDFEECYIEKEVLPVNARQPDLTHVPTPAFDEILEEYFQPTKSTNYNSTIHNHGDSTYQTQSLYEDNVDQSDLGTLPPAHLYYFHKDPMIQRLVRGRLPNFVPLHSKSNVDHMQQNVCGIDYMSQFGHGESSKSKQTKQKEIKQPSASRSQKKARKTNVREFPQGSEGWVNPKSCEIPKDAGKRRVQAVSKTGSGHWYCNDGRRVYVANNGQELTGRAAYMQYKRESGGGVGSKKSKKNSSTKKKTAAKKK